MKRYNYIIKVAISLYFWACLLILTASFVTSSSSHVKSSRIICRWSLFSVLNMSFSQIVYLWVEQAHTAMKSEKALSDQNMSRPSFKHFRSQNKSWIVHVDLRIIADLF